MPFNWNTSSIPQNPLDTNTKDQINDYIDQLLEPFGGDTLGIPLKNVPGYVGTVLKAIQVAPLVFQILADITTIIANMVSIATDVYNSSKLTELECICAELKCQNELLRQAVFANQSQAEAQKDAVRGVVFGMDVISRSILASSQAQSLEEIPPIPLDPEAATLTSDYYKPDREWPSDLIQCDGE